MSLFIVNIKKCTSELSNLKEKEDLHLKLYNDEIGRYEEQ